MWAGKNDSFLVSKHKSHSLRNLSFTSLRSTLSWHGLQSDMSKCADVCAHSALVTPSLLRLSESGVGMQRPLGCMESRTSCNNLKGRECLLVSQVTDGSRLASNK